MVFDPTASYRRAETADTEAMQVVRSPARRGAPAKYNEQFARTAYQLAILGLSAKQMAKAVGISASTFHTWRERHPDFEEAVRTGKEIAEAKVAASLFHRACGYSHEAVEMFYDSKTGQVVTVPYVKRYPPDTQAAIFWLKNRQPELWRDKVNAEHGGPEGSPMEVATMDVPQLLALRQQALATLPP